jgi:hypothetical protein
MPVYGKKSEPPHKAINEMKSEQSRESSKDALHRECDPYNEWQVQRIAPHPTPAYTGCCQDPYNISVVNSSQRGQGSALNRRFVGV